MKNRRGEIATLLTLGLVLVGGVAAIATSIFTNNQKNIASNPKASCTSSYQPCTTVKSTYTKGGYYAGGGEYYEKSNCVSPIVIGVGNYCKGLNPSPAPAAPAAASPAPAQSVSPGCSAANSSAACSAISVNWVFNSAKKECCPPQASAPVVSPSTAPVTSSNDVLTADRLCCKVYGCGQYGAPADKKMVKVVGYTGTYKGTAGYTSCGTTGYTNVQQCSSITGAPTSNGATGYVACEGVAPAAPNSSVDPDVDSGAGGLTGPGGVEYCCIVYKQGLYASQYGCDASQYVAKVVGFTGNKDGTDGYTSCATTGYEKYSTIQKVGNCSGMAETQSLASAGSGSICVGNPDKPPVSSGTELDAPTTCKPALNSPDCTEMAKQYGISMIFRTASKMCCPVGVNPPAAEDQTGECSSPISCPANTTGGPYYSKMVKKSYDPVAYPNYYKTKDQCKNNQNSYMNEREIIEEVCKPKTQTPETPQSGVASGTSCFTSTSKIGSYNFIDKPDDVVKGTARCGGVVIYNSSTLGTILRECPTSGNECRYSCYNAQNAQINCTGVSDVHGGGIRKVTVVNNTGSEIEITGKITKNNTNSISIGQVAIGSAAGTNFYTKDFSNVDSLDCAFLSTIHFTVMYRKKGDTVWSTPFSTQERCAGTVNLLVSIK